MPRVHCIVEKSALLIYHVGITASFLFDPMLPTLLVASLPTVGNGLKLFNGRNLSGNWPKRLFWLRMGLPREVTYDH